MAGGVVGACDECDTRVEQPLQQASVLRSAGVPLPRQGSLPHPQVERAVDDRSLCLQVIDERSHLG